MTLLLDLSKPGIRVLAPAELRGRKLTIASTTQSAELDALLGLDFIGVVVRDDEAAEARIFGLPPGRYAIGRSWEDDPQPVEFEVGVAPLTIDLR